MGGLYSSEHAGHPEALWHGPAYRRYVRQLMLHSVSAIGEFIVLVLYTCADIQLSSVIMCSFTGDAVSISKRKW